MRSAISLATFLLCAAAFAATPKPKPEPEVDPKHSVEAEKTAKERIAAIRAELKQLGDHAWAGEYYCGDGFGMNVSVQIAPKAGYVFEWHGCLGVYDRNYGAVSELVDALRLSFTFENQRWGVLGISRGLIPVHWSSRHYLIPSDDVVGFCNRVNSGDEPRTDAHGRYLLRDGDEKKAVTGQPEVPQGYREYLLAKPVEARIVAIGKSTTRPSVIDFKYVDIPVTLDKGEQDGLRWGMTLFPIEPKNSVDWVTIVDLEPNRCQAIMTQTDEKHSGPRPQVGWRLSTASPFHSRPETSAKT